MADVDRRKFLAGSLSALALSVAGCGGYTDGMTLDEILALLKEYLDESKETDDETISGLVRLAITYPAGRSPRVFTSGWLFGARALDGDKDISSAVKWSGSGTFQPDTGPSSRPVFSSDGQNTITLSVVVGEKTVQKTVSVTAVSPVGYCALGDKSQVPADAHGCPACPHPAVGPAITGSPNILVNGRPALRVGDRGVHAACCGPNTWEVATGDQDVLINGKAAAWKKSVVNHCGGEGIMTEWYRG